VAKSSGALLTSTLASIVASTRKAFMHACGLQITSLVTLRTPPFQRKALHLCRCCDSRHAATPLTQPASRPRLPDGMRLIERKNDERQMHFDHEMLCDEFFSEAGLRLYIKTSPSAGCIRQRPAGQKNKGHMHVHLRTCTSSEHQRCNQ